MQWQQGKAGRKSRWQIPRCRRCSQRRRSALERPLSSGMRPGFSIPVWAFPCYKTSGKSHHLSASPSVSSLVKWAKKQPPNFTVGGGQGNPLQYPCLENPMDKGAWWATVRGGRKVSDTTEVTKHTTSPRRRLGAIPEAKPLSHGRHLLKVGASSFRETKQEGDDEGPVLARVHDRAGSAALREKEARGQKPESREPGSENTSGLGVQAAPGGPDHWAPPRPPPASFLPSLTGPAGPVSVAGSATGGLLGVRGNAFRLEQLPARLRPYWPFARGSGVPNGGRR